MVYDVMDLYRRQHQIEVNAIVKAMDSFGVDFVVSDYFLVFPSV
jgi:hypothetical protein